MIHLSRIGTLQYMSPDVVLVPPMGYGPEVNTRTRVVHQADRRFCSGGYLECGMYGD